MDRDKRDFIAESNKRSQLYGIVKNQKMSKRVLDDRELSERIKRKHELIYVANPFINQLYDFVKSSNFIVILNDEEGCILNIIGNDNMLQKAFETALVPGAFMVSDRST